MLYTASHTGV
ncbi:hypothetical protein F383_12307 [Gossypium arboreum]|uniref:Uncharacterized protein n=1 Tax=Gossypium arboreum TaxID=29729 RepID=A0A0B0NHI0_GOSAR|nr:hypothetical protein F383_12307 [Gossypium arboreum]